MRTNAEIERVVDEYATMLLRVAYSQLNNRAEAEDAVQEVLLKYIEKAPTFQSEEHEKAWVIRAAGNACKNLLRAPHHSRRALLEQAHTVAAPEASDHAILEAIRALPHRYRDAVALCCWEGYSAEEAARLLGISPDAVRKRLERARGMLKNDLKGAFI